MSLFYPMVGAAVAVAGGDKLAGNKAYDRMFRDIGWSDFDMRAAAAAEVAGGVLMLAPRTRRLGGFILAVASGAVLASELKANEPKLAAPRAAVLLAALAAMIAPGRKRTRIRYA